MSCVRRTLAALKIRTPLLALTVAIAAGALTLFRAEALPPAIDLDQCPVDPAQCADLTVYGDDQGDWSAYAVAVGDISGDGTDDLIVGAPLADPGGRGAAGETYVIYGECVDNDADAICDLDDRDDDNDGCADAEEVALGSVFDSYAWYDVYDVPVPAYADPQPNGPRNKVVGIGDVLAVLFYTFADEGGPPNANGVSYDSDKGVDRNGDTAAEIPPDGVPDGRSYDRSPGMGKDPVTGIDPAGAPNGVIDIGDVLACLAQVFVVDCSE